MAHCKALLVKMACNTALHTIVQEVFVLGDKQIRQSCSFIVLAIGFKGWQDVGILGTGTLQMMANYIRLYQTHSTDTKTTYTKTTAAFLYAKRA